MPLTDAPDAEWAIGKLESFVDAINDLLRARRAVKDADDPWGHGPEVDANEAKAEAQSQLANARTILRRIFEPWPRRSVLPWSSTVTVTTPMAMPLPEIFTFPGRG